MRGWPWTRPRKTQGDRKGPLRRSGIASEPALAMTAPHTQAGLSGPYRTLARDEHTAPAWSKVKEAGTLSCQAAP